MPRMAGIVIAGRPHHVVERGNNREDVFFVDDDRRACLEFLREYCERFGFNAAGYCLLGGVRAVSLGASPLLPQAPMGDEIE